MKQVLLFISMFLTTSLYAYTVCGPYIPNNAEIAYDDTRHTNYIAQKWAVGIGCVGATTEKDFSKMCQSVYVAGEAYAGYISVDGQFDPVQYPTGSTIYDWCHCRLTHVRSNNQLVERIGQWVMAAYTSSSCARYCAEHVAFDKSNLRTPIMLLPSMI